MKTPAVNHANILRIYKSAWFVTDTEIADMKKTYVFQSIPVPAGDLYHGLYLGVAHDDFDKFQRGEKLYRVIAVCKELIDKMK